ncbi:unnamed protein product [Allacma fusca]|uniref:Peptidase S26 domain-containing protein n=1 Tax=Allacma fusca TaxID=39272 RepID=A0A8J2KDP8_9HEXA|nr:unnamed protein product [Allacma fusca]
MYVSLGSAYCGGPVMERISSHYGRIPRNSIVVSKSPSNPKNSVCKRVIAIAGDQVLIPDGTTTMVPKGHVWLEGDNFQNSLDSRSYGPIPIGLIQGRAIFRVWPPSAIGTLPIPTN